MVSVGYVHVCVQCKLQGPRLFSKKSSWEPITSKPLKPGCSKYKLQTPTIYFLVAKVIFASGHWALLEHSREARFNHCISHVLSELNLGINFVEIIISLVKHPDEISLMN